MNPPRRSHPLYLAERLCLAASVLALTFCVGCTSSDETEGEEGTGGFGGSAQEDAGAGGSAGGEPTMSGQGGGARADDALGGRGGHEDTGDAGGMAGVTPLGGSGGVTDSGPAEDALPGAVTLSGLRFEIPCTPAANPAHRTCVADPARVTSPALREIPLGGPPGRTYHLRVRVRGLIEANRYADRAGQVIAPSQGPHAATDVFPQVKDFRTYAIVVSNPGRIIYLNAYHEITHESFVVDYTLELEVRGDAVLRLQSADDSADMLSNPQTKVVAGVAPAPEPYFGQFLQFDVLSVTSEALETTSAGCEAPSGDPGAREGSHRIEINGQARDYIVRLPEGYSETRAWPLVFGFHPAGMDASETYFDRDSGSTGFRGVWRDKAVFVMPRAIPSTWNSWSKDIPANLAFFDALLEKMGRALCIDQAQVFAMGMSSGGAFSQTLGCQRGDKLRAIAGASGQWLEQGAGCRGTVKAWLSDDVDISGSEPRIVVDKIRDVAAAYRRFNGCDDKATATFPEESCRAYAGCIGDGAVHICDSGGHTWPSYAPSAIRRFFLGE